MIACFQAADWNIEINIESARAAYYGRFFSFRFHNTVVAYFISLNMASLDSGLHLPCIHQAPPVT